MNVTDIKLRLINSQLFKNSFWAIAGNGVGSGLLLLAGIIIARLLGSDLYGEYGMVKSTMFYIASFATLGLGITSTRYVAQYINKNGQYVAGIIKDILNITFVTSLIMAIILVLFSSPLSSWLGSEKLKMPLRFLGIIIVARAVNTSQMGILGGMKAYEKSAINSFISGLAMLILSIPLTFFFSLSGALLSLLLSQLLNCILNRISIHKITVRLTDQIHKNFKKELIKFSFPVALQESTYFICNWGGLLILTKFSSIQEVGIYSAAAQWNSIILFIPGMLYNVVISHLSSHIGEANSQKKIMKIMLLVNLISTAVPFVIIWLLSSWIASFYGPTFKALGPVLSVLTCSTIFICCSNVFRSQFLANGKNWLLLGIRSVKDCVFLGGAYLIIRYFDGNDGSLYYAWAALFTSIFYFLVLLLYSLKIFNKSNR